VRRALTLARALLASGILGAPVAAAADAVTAFVDVNLVTMDEEQVLPHRAVLVRGGAIAAVGTVKDVAVPKGARRIPGGGRYLMPGLADMHIHIPPEASDDASASREMLLLVAHGVTTARVMIGQPEHLALRDRIARDERLGPTLIVAGPPLGVAPGSLPGAPRVDSPADAARVPPEQKAVGYDCVKVLDGLPRDQYDALLASARTAGIPVVGHVPQSVPLEHALEAGQASIEHLSGYVEALIADDSPLRGRTSLRVSEAMGAIDESKLPRLAAATRTASVWNTPTLFFWRALISADPPERLLERPGMEYVPADERRAWAEERRKALVARPPDRDAIARYHALRLRITQALHRAGAGLLLGTDSPDAFTVVGVAVHEELKLLVEAGLTPYQALRAGTADASAFLGGDRFGLVAVGRRADLLLVEGNPLADVGNVALLSGVMVRGRWLTRQELTAKLAQRRLRKVGG
jgi:imidazolonepropionase-like amidohydrolase